MKRILITGGGGDWAQSFRSRFKEKYEIHTPSRTDLDVTSIQSVQAYFEHSTYDIVINNAGSIHPARVLEADSQKWINDINVNLIGTFLVTQHALQADEKTQIINISSTAAFNAYPNWSSYCAAKAGVNTLSASLANDGYNVYCLCPGAIDTKFRDNLNLSNDNAMHCDLMSDYVFEVIQGKYQPGDVLFFRKNEFVLNP